MILPNIQHGCCYYKYILCGSGEKKWSPLQDKVMEKIQCIIKFFFSESGKGFESKLGWNVSCLILYNQTVYE
jgi:hypothetical protein